MQAFLQLTFEVLTSNVYPLEILYSITFLGLTGPESDASFPCGGRVTPGATVLSERLPLSLSSLLKNRFVSDHAFHTLLIVYFRRESLGRILAHAKPIDVVRAILAPHRTRQVCPISVSDLYCNTRDASTLILSQPSLLRLGAPVVIVGDLHGNYIDLIRIFEKYGFPNVASYLFLGDLVDRGPDSLDIIVLLLAFKLLYPETLFIIRGDHEAVGMSLNYGFKDECDLKHLPLDAFVPVFEALPMAAIVGQKIFCVHGGLSPLLLSLEQIEEFKRPNEVPSYGPMHDLLWTDANPNISWFSSSPRGPTYTFGNQATIKFLKTFGFQMIVRGHEVAKEGYAQPFGHEVPFVTVFSSSGYEVLNKGSVMVVDHSLKCALDAYSVLPKADAARYDTMDLNHHVPD
jgi:serine/threonine-protein phosphatase PP1 catalytic subunit